MSANFTGVTFAKQKVTPSYDGIVRRAMLTDGTLTGCEMSYSGSTLTMAAGQMMICGRQIVHPSSQNWAVTEQTSGYARLVITIDLTRTSTKDNFDQVVDTIQYATSVDGFAPLDQSDINTTGTKYQVAACVVSLGTGGITGIVSKLEKCEGGGASLNFKVVGGTTAPGSPTENTIWVNTSVAIPAWSFSATEPETPVAGMVWISTGSGSSVAFNALKKNAIQVYPMNAKQYVGGQWVSVEAKTYQDGEWVSWFDGQIYDSGTVYTEAGAYVVPDTSEVEYADSYISTATTAAKTSEAFAVFGPVDLTSFDVLVMAAKFTDGAGANASHNHVLYVAKGKDTSYTDAAAIQKVNKTSGYTTETTVTLDISGLTGLYYVFAGQHTDGSSWQAKRTQQITSVTAENGAAAQYANLINQLSEVYEDAET